MIHKATDEIVDIFWQEFKQYTYIAGPYSYQSGWFDNNDAVAERSNI